MGHNFFLLLLTTIRDGGGTKIGDKVVTKRPRAGVQRDNQKLIEDSPQGSKIRCGEQCECHISSAVDISEPVCLTSLFSSIVVITQGSQKYETNTMTLDVP